jgi:hypothetical protein
MNKAAIGSRQLAINCPMSELSPIAYRRLPTASTAKFCTVTSPPTSVTNGGLANSVLIEVGEVQSAQGQWTHCVVVFGPWERPADCSFGELLCIQ